MIRSDKQHYLTEFTLSLIAQFGHDNRLSEGEENQLVSCVLNQPKLFFALAAAYHDQSPEKYIGLLLRFSECDDLDNSVGTWKNLVLHLSNRRGCITMRSLSAVDLQVAF